MQDVVSQARKEGMISTGIDLFLAALPVVFIVVGFISFDRPRIFDDEMANYIASGILIAFICASVFFRLRALRKISVLSGIKAAALYRNCVILCIFFFVLVLVSNYFYPRELNADGEHSNNPFAAILGLAFFVGAIYNRIVVSYKFLFGARKRREYLSHLCVALCGTFRAKYTMQRSNHRFSPF